jgi:hypothetical protein
MHHFAFRSHQRHQRHRIGKRADDIQLQFQRGVQWIDVAVGFLEGRPFVLPLAAHIHRLRCP